MKRFCLGFLLGALLTAALGSAWIFLGLPIGSGHFMHNGLFPFARVEEMGGLRISLGRSNSNSVVITRGSDSFTLVPTVGEVYDNPTATPDGRSLFFLVWKELDFGYKYACLLRVDFTANALSSNQVSRILTAAQVETLLGKDNGVTDLFKTSPIGDCVLIYAFKRTESMGPQGKITFMHQLPYWYDIKNNTLQEPVP